MNGQNVDYVISIPHLRSAKAEVGYNEKLGDWTYNFEQKALREYGLNAISFCFFVEWNETKSDGKINPDIWVKRQITIPNGETIDLNNKLFDEKIIELETVKKLKEKNSFSRYNHLNCYYMIIKHLIHEKELKMDEKVAVKIQYLENETFQKRVYDLNSFQEELIKKSGGPFVNKKPLYSYETELEYYLSTTSNTSGALFPGDCDMLLYDDEYKCCAIIEFKKCTSRSKLKISEQSVENFIDKDRSKYLRLNILREYLQRISKKKIPLINVFYPTTQEMKIKLEAVESDLSVGNVVEYEIVENVYDNHLNLIKNICEHFLEEKIDEGK